MIAYAAEDRRRDDGGKDDNAKDDDGKGGGVKDDNAKNDVPAPPDHPSKKPPMYAADEKTGQKK